MIRLKNLIMEKIADSEDKDFVIMVNHVNYTGKYFSSMPFNEVMTKDSAEEIVQFVLDEIESGNIRDPETGEYQYDVDKLDGNIEFDCSIPIEGFQIDLRVEYDENANIVNTEIQDYDIADKFGIDVEDIIEKLS